MMWVQRFIKIFQPFSTSKLKLLKLHSWIYHIVLTIQNYGILNKYILETYENLYKNYVKQLY